MADREIAYGVEEPGVYDGVLYWVGTDGVAFQRFTDTHMTSKAQPFIDAYNVAAAREALNVPRETSEPSDE
jgi:hypothetical protein